MPSPVGHALGGLIVGLLVSPGPVRTGGGPDAASAVDPPPDRPARGGAETLQRWRGTMSPRLAGAAWLGVIACLPDLDFLWGRHGAETHSLGAALLAGGIAWWWTGRRSARLALVVGLAWFSHPVFDWLGSDDTPPLGVMALWPFTRDYYFAHAYVFDAISRRYWLNGFVAHNVRAVVREVLLLAPIAVAVSWFRKADSPSDPVR